MLSRKTLAGALIALVVVLAGSGYAGYRVWRHFRVVAPQSAPRTAIVITAPPTAPASDAARSTPVATPLVLQPSAFIKVPFTSQSPFAQWSAQDPHQEYCEAAALLMMHQYFSHDGRAVIPKAEADAAMAHIVSVERKTFPGVKDLPLNDIATVGQQLFGLQPTVEPVDLAKLETYISQGFPVIIPVMTHGANGARINGNYGSVNVYHVILVTGYDSGSGLLYTNDAGLMEGQNLRYRWSVLSTAIDAQVPRLGQGRVMLTFRAS
jgi:Peptidase_C39 like family